MNEVTIAELTAKLAEILRAVQNGESFEVVDTNRVVARICPIREASGIRIRKPATGSLPPNKVPLPEFVPLKIDVLDLLLEERH